MTRATLLDRVEETTRSTLLAFGPPVDIPSNAFLVHDGEDAGCVFLVVEGLLKVVKNSIDGRTSFLGLRRGGTVVGELGVLAGATRSSSVQAVQPSSVIKIGDDHFERLLAEHPDLRRTLLSELAVRLREATLQIHDLMNADARMRIAARLVQLADETPDAAGTSPTIHLPVSQEELGDWAGLSRAGAVKALRSLRDGQLIDTSRMSITIRDLPELRRVSTV
jgi:CRP-like cAMP-binding protein